MAQALYWTARDLERAEALARLLEAGHAAALEGRAANGAGGRLVWEAVVRVAGDLRAFLETHRRADERSVSWFLTFGRDNRDSIAACLERARENARSVRDRLPTDVWEGVNDAWLELGGWPPQRIARDGVYPFCRDVRRAVTLVCGLVEQSMRRDEGWWFVRLGRALERAERAARLVRERRGPGPDAPGADVLELHGRRMLLGDASAFEAYVQSDAGSLSAGAVARFLLLDRRFPRSVAFALGEVEAAIGALVAMDAMAPDPAALLLARTARDMLDGAARRPWDAGEAGDLIERLLVRCASIDEALTASCFLAGAERRPIGQHAQAARQAQN
ncbi:alpha-E domain-containing protein [Miltoncostaea marina]|uniref:alpha-E domain-containing protein n=1 Tax=Miltoncostaea marina TaxID=2843215 RepID=UPI001C3C3BE3|nr:alpha-E domain-containing protein [Miltoncostaea marina]